MYLRKSAKIYNPRKVTRQRGYFSKYIVYPYYVLLHSFLTLKYHINLGAGPAGGFAGFAGGPAGGGLGGVAAPGAGSVADNPVSIHALFSSRREAPTAVAAFGAAGDISTTATSNFAARFLYV